MILKCPNCQARYRVDPLKIKSGTVRIKCPKCKTPFTIKVPCETQESSKQSTAAAQSTDLSKRRVLLIEDARFFRELVLDVLKPLNLELITAADGLEGFGMALRERPDLVILDLNLPGRNGYDLIKDMRSRTELGHTRILAISAVYRKDEDQAKAQQVGADDFISKSFKPEFLQKRVRELLAESR